MAGSYTDSLSSPREVGAGWGGGGWGARKGGREWDGDFDIFLKKKKISNFLIPNKIIGQNYHPRASVRGRMSFKP